MPFCIFSYVRRSRFCLFYSFLPSKLAKAVIEYGKIGVFVQILKDFTASHLKQKPKCHHYFFYLLGSVAPFSFRTLASTRLKLYHLASEFCNKHKKMTRKWLHYNFVVGVYKTQKIWSLAFQGELPHSIFHSFPFLFLSISFVTQSVVCEPEASSPGSL